MSEATSRGGDDPPPSSDSTSENPLDTPLIDSEGNTCNTPLSVLLSQAVKLKSAQDKPLRSKFDSYPIFVQNSIFPRDDVETSRSKPFRERMKDAVAFKSNGNAAMRDQQFRDAMIEYEKAVACFRFLVNTNSNWKKEGIRDDFILSNQFISHNIDDTNQVTTFLAKCYTNIALVNIKTMQYQLATVACNEALSACPTNVKALYLRSKARLEPKSAGRVEEDLALKDLYRAKDLDPTNKDVLRELKRIMSRRARQKVRDRTIFRGIFDKEDWKNDERSSSTNSKKESNTQSGGADPLFKPEISSSQSQPATSMINQTSPTSSLEHEDIIDTGNAFFNLSNPSEKMITEAFNFGVDLKDHRVKSMLEKMHQSQQLTREEHDKKCPNMGQRHIISSENIENSSPAAKKCRPKTWANALLSSLCKLAGFVIFMRIYTLSFYYFRKISSAEVDYGYSIDDLAYFQSFI